MSLTVLSYSLADRTDSFEPNSIHAFLFPVAPASLTAVTWPHTLKYSASPCMTEMRLSLVGKPENQIAKRTLLERLRPAIGARLFDDI